MLLTFGKRISLGASVRLNINYVRYGSITRSNKNILSDCLQTRNPIALITELKRISNDGASASKYPGSTSATENLAEMIARLLICRSSSKLSMAFQVLECLNEIKPEILVFGIYEIIDKCVEHGHIDDAMKAYERLQNLNIQLDVFRKERLMSALAPRCRVDDIIALLSDHSVTDSDLVLSAEPLIMSGKVSIYGSFLNKYLDQSSDLEDPFQCPEEVARVTRSIMAARLRRFFDSSEPSEDENDGMLDILTTLQTYHMNLLCSPLPKHAGSLDSQSYFQSRQLCEIEKDRGLEMIQTNFLSSHQLELIDHLPEFEITDFPYVAEGNGQAHIEPIHRLRIRDLTAELKRRNPKRILLFDKGVFPDTYDMVTDYLHQRCLVQAIKNLMKRTGFIVDVIPDEEEAEYPFLSPYGHSGRPPPFILNDISHYFQTKKPSVTLLFNNDIFDSAHDMNVREVEITDFDEESDSRPSSTSSKPNTEDSNSASPSGVPNVSNFSPEEDEPEK